MKTFIAKLKTVKHNWYTVDAKDKTLGRLATQIVRYLCGKHKVEYTPHLDTGDYIIVLNSKKIKITGNKYYEKIYYRYTGYVGGIKKIIFKDMISTHPDRIIKIAVKGMLPKGPLGRKMYKKLKIYDGSIHNHIAQKPQILNI